MDWFYFSFTMSALFSSIIRPKEVSRCPLWFCVANASTRQTVYLKMLNKDEPPVDFALDFLEARTRKNGHLAQILTRGVMTGVQLLDFCSRTNIVLEMECMPVIDISHLELSAQLNDMFEEDDAEQ